MCGRTRTNITKAQLEEIFKNFEFSEPVEPSFNLAPTELAPIIAYGKKGLSLINARFGLIPSWAKKEKIGPATVNARLETAATNHIFRAAFEKRHCLVPVSGFYEWRAEGAVKQPYLFERRDGRPLCLAGLWEYWKPEGVDKGVLSFAILTTEANSLMREYSERMPVILDEAEYDPWLTTGANRALLDSYPSQLLNVRKVGTGVNNVRNKADILKAA